MPSLRVIEVPGESPLSWADATFRAVNKISSGSKVIRSTFVQSQSVSVANGEVEAFKVNVKITFEE